jgi:serine protease Do
MHKLLIILCLLIYSCTNEADKNTILFDSLKSKENALLKEELKLKNKELELAYNNSTNRNFNNLPISELYKKMKSSVFIIYNIIGDSCISQGTGFFLNSEGVALSNYHVFENADESIIILDNGEKCLINKIISFDKESDYVIFQVDNHANNFNSLNITDSMPDIGSTCFAIGNPKGLTQTLSIGNISGYRDENKYIQTTTEITHGSSGGPLFNSKGEVIGITSCGMGDANLNFAINISNIPYQDFTYSNLRFPQELEIIDLDLIKSTIEKYFVELNNKNFIKLEEFYTPTLDRYYDDFDISSISAVENSKNYLKTNNLTSLEHNINWDTFNLQKTNSETFLITFNSNGIKYDKLHKKPEDFKTDIVMTLTKDMKIKSIYENIINLNNQ